MSPSLSPTALPCGRLDKPFPHPTGGPHRAPAKEGAALSSLGARLVALQAAGRSEAAYGCRPGEVAWEGREGVGYSSGGDRLVGVLLALR